MTTKDADLDTKISNATENRLVFIITNVAPQKIFDLGCQATGSNSSLGTIKKPVLYPHALYRPSEDSAYIQSFANLPRAVFATYTYVIQLPEDETEYIKLSSFHAHITNNPTQSFSSADRVFIRNYIDPKNIIGAGVSEKLSNDSPNKWLKNANFQPIKLSTRAKK